MAGSSASGMASRIDRMMDRVRYFLATTPDELDAIYRLRHAAYLGEDAISPRPDGRFSDRYDLDDNAYVMGLELDGDLVGSIRLHITRPDFRVGPACDTFGDVLMPLLDADESFVDPSRFVVDRRIRSETVLMPFAALRLGSMLADHFDATYMLATPRLEHKLFYDRVCRLHPRTEPRAYPGLSKPLLLSFNSMTALREALHPRFPVLTSTSSERSALFGPSTAILSQQTRTGIANDNASLRHSWRRVASP